MKDLVSKIIALSEEFRVNAEKNVAGNKAAGVRARKISLELGVLLKDFRKESVAHDK
jgi:hypothetical protein